MPDTPPNERLTRVETLMETCLKNQGESRERSHDLANTLQVMNGRLDGIERKIDDSNVKDEVREIKVEMTAQGARIDAMEKLRDKVLTGVQIVKYMCWITGGFFTLSLALGEKLAKLPIWSFAK